MPRTYTPYGSPKKTGKGVALTIFKASDDGRDAKKRAEKNKKVPALLTDYRNIWARPTYNPETDSKLGSMQRVVSI